MIANKYRVSELISHGSFGAVFRGTDGKGEPVAIKIERPTSDNCKMLKHETTILRYLYECGVRCCPKIYWFGPYDATSSSLVMSFYERDICGIPFCQLMAGCISAVSHIHRHSIVHRDLKPANIRLDERGKPVLIDFGLAVAINDRPTNGIVGSPKYTSYYNHFGGPFGKRDDLISLGYIYISSLFEPLWSSSDICECKMWDNLHKRLSGDILTYMKYCYGLGSQEEPCYQLLGGLFFQTC